MGKRQRKRRVEAYRSPEDRGAVTGLAVVPETAAGRTPGIDSAPAPEGARSRMARHRTMLMVVFLVAIGQGLLYLFLLPPWQHYDEPTHFEYAWLIANHEWLPDEDDTDRAMRREVSASMVEHDFFWNLGPPDLLTDDEQIWLGWNELAHPPAYYLLVSLPLRPVRHLDMASQLYVARSVSVLLFLLTVLIAAALARELTPPGHPLRWALPLTVAMLPPFVNQMTAVNNDVGAVFTVSLFLWGAVRTIRLGLSWRRLLWLLGASLLAVASKNTAAITFALIPPVLLLALWSQRGWRWRSLLFALFGLIGVTAVTLLSWGDAAHWYRVMRDGVQEESTRQQVDTAVSGTHALMLETTPDNAGRRLMSPLAHASVARVRGQSVTVGGWIWAERDAKLVAPGLLVGMRGQTGFKSLTEPIEVSTTPTFFARQVTIPDDAGKIYYTLFGHSPTEQTEPLRYFVDDTFLIAGELPAGVMPEVREAQVVAGGQTRKNLVRNPGAERGTVRLNGTVNRWLYDYAHRSPDVILSVLLDYEQSAPHIFGTLLPHLVRDFFQAFAWGHVRLSGAFWDAIIVLLLLGALAGTVKWLLKESRRAALYQQLSVLLLALVGIGIWAAAMVWPLPYLVAKVLLPSGRYTYPAVLPMALFLVGGWAMVPPKPYRPAGLFLLFALLLLLNLAAVQTIWHFYTSLPAN